ncbi:uncharacterized protein LOC111605827 isoform X1 [Xiphophorus maculatus]|uniref:uncharacterized protein LOC111605827 isoform X1 n=1 Tax=Xiphophorus maculatus TaxID=8083 RepID=UPI000C6D9F91|nr:uncharacterized protein LOC111605827 isoform X1 [Xiphophorus maculatus]
MQSDTHLLCRVVISFTMIGCLVFIVLLGSFQELQVQALPQAKLTADSSLIKDTDSVTLSCRAPARVSVHQCYFYVNGGTQTHFPCIKTFTGTELLWMRKKSLPSVAEVRCFYTVNYGTVNSPSPHSDVSYITISLKPQITVNYRKGQSAFVTCFLPGSVKQDTTCNLYFGESSRPAAATIISKTRSRINQWFCWTEIQENEFLRHLGLAEQKEASCDYRLERDGKSLSPRSDPYRLTGIVEGDLTEIRKTTRFMKTTSSSNAVFPIQESVTQRTVTVLITGTTKLTTSISSISTSTKSGHVEGELTEISKIPTRSTKTESSSDAALPIQESIPSTTVTVFTTGPREPTKSKTTSTPASSTVTSTSQRTTNVNFIFIDTRILAIAAAVVGGVIVVSILVVAACLIAKRRTGKGLHNRKQANLKDQSVWMKVTDNTEMLPLDKDGVYSVITSAPAADRPAGPGKPAKEKPQTEDSDVYHVYCTIPDLPPPSTRDDRVYCLLQNH